METIEALLKKLDNQEKELIRIICPLFNYEKSPIFELFLDSNMELKIKLSCHNHILSIKSYFKYYLEKYPSKITNLCEYKHHKLSKAIAYCFNCKSNICENCIISNHQNHGKQNFSNLTIDKNLITNEYKVILKNISYIIEKIKKQQSSILSERQYNNLETLLFFYIVKRISYNEYLEESKNANFSYACLMNLNYIRDKSPKKTIENILNMDEKESLFNLNIISDKDYLFNTENISDDNNIFNEEMKITLESNTCNFMDGNDAYIILVSRSRKIFIYSFKSNKPLFSYTENGLIKSIRFSFDDCNLFLCLTNNEIKINKIWNNKCEIIKKIKLEENAEIQDCYFIPKNKDNILVVYDGFIRIFNYNNPDIYSSLNLNSSNNSVAFSNDGRVIGYFDDNLLSLYKFQDGKLNKINDLNEDFSSFYIRKINKTEKYNLILINSNYINYYNDINTNKFEKIQLLNKVNYSHYDNNNDFLYLYTDSLIIIQISNWERILQIKHKSYLIPLNSFKQDSKILKRFISLENLKQKILYEYSFHCYKLIEKIEHEGSKTDNVVIDISGNKITKLSERDLSYINNIIKDEIKKKKYLNIPEIKNQLDQNFQYSISTKKKIAKKYLENFHEEGPLYKQYIELIKIIINDNVEKDILMKYLSFLYKNKDKEELKDENINSYDEEIKYYKVCFTPQELIEKFNYRKDKDEKTEFLFLLQEISNRQINEQNISNSFKDLEDIKENISTFNQPIEFNNKELYFYMNKVTLAIEILKKKDKNKFKSIKNIQSTIKLVLKRKLFDNDDIINNESKFSKLMIIILRGQEEEIAEYNINLIKEIHYTNEDKKKLLLNSKESLFLKPKIVPRMTIDLSNINIEEIDNKYNFSNYLINLKKYANNENNELYKEFELLNYEQLLNHFKSKININKIKNFMKSILLSNTIKDAFKILYEEKYKYPFNNEDEASEYVEKYIDFIAINDKTAKGATNKYNLQTKIFLKKCKIFNPTDISETILYGCLYSGIIIKIFIHELNHEFYNFYFYHSNGTIPLSTPRKSTIKGEGEGGKYFEILLFKQSLKNINLTQAAYILNRKNYDKALTEFSKDFILPKENDLIIEGEFSYLNKEISELKKQNEEFKNYYLKTDEDEYFDFSDLEMDADVQDDVIG